MSKSQQYFLYVVIFVASLLITACDDNTGSQNAQRLVQAAQSIDKDETAISVETLSDRIIKRQNDYLLFDVRPQAEYDMGYIKSAKSVSATELLSEESIKGLANGRNIYIYSNSSGRAAQLTALLRLQGIPAYYLNGGYTAWSRQMTNVSDDSGKSAQELAKQQAVSCWFEGDYVASAGLAVKSAGSGGYVPPLEPVRTAVEEDPLGLGLGLGLGSDDISPSPPKSTGGTLKIGEGC